MAVKPGPMTPEARAEEILAGHVDELIAAPDPQVRLGLAVTLLIDDAKLLELVSCGELDLRTILERLLCASASKSRQGRPLGAKTVAIREAVLELTGEYQVMTVRQIFYALTVRGIVPKDENAGYRPVQTQLLKMRREELIPWSFIADATRWQRKPETWDRSEEALAVTVRTYRRNLWQSQSVRAEVWLEKDALASVVMKATAPWDVALMVSRGQASDTFIYEAAQVAREAWDEELIETIIFALYDADKSGRIAAQKVAEKITNYSGDAPITFELLAVSDDQITDWNLPTRPAKEKGEPDAVELDAIPPNRLISLVEDAIVGLIDADAWEKEQAVERSEREILERMVGAA